MVTPISRPYDDEYAPYYGAYVSRVPEGDVFDLLARQPAALRDLLDDLPADAHDFRHAPNEWSIKEVIGHVNDAERVFAYRALRFSRRDATALPGFEQDDYVREANFAGRTLSDLLEEFELLRRANLLAFNRLAPEAYLCRGTASGYEFSVRALIYTLAGHVEYHLESLRNDYLAKL